MKTGLVHLAALLLAGACLAESPRPTPFAAVKVNAIVSDAAIHTLHSSLLVFLSDSVLAYTFQSSPVDSSAQQHLIATFIVKPGSLSLLAQNNAMPVSAHFGGLSRTADGKLVVATLPPLERDVRIYDSRLSETYRFHAGSFFEMSPTGSTILVFIDKTPRLFRTAPVSQLANIPTSPMTISDNAFATQQGNSVLIYSFDGSRKGVVTISKKCVSHAHFLSPDRLYLNSCRPGWTQEIVDFSGQGLVRLALPKGWGNNQSDAEGNRMVFDIFTESLWASIKGFKNLEDTADGEAIRVIDTKTGNNCFSLNLPMDKAHEGPMHASISPSGKFVAIVNDENIAVFELPVGPCSGR